MEAPSRSGRALLLAVVFVLLPSLVLAGAPTLQIRGTIDRVIGILKDPAMKAPAEREKRRDLLRSVIAPVFDFGEMSRRSLGPDWRGRTPGERKRFTTLFRELLENSYLGKIESYHGEEIRYGEETLDGPYAEVKTLVVTRKGQEIPVDYRMLDEGGSYRIYDVVIEGISLVRNYRSQFRDLLQRESFEEMIQKLRATIRNQQS